MKYIHNIWIPICFLFVCSCQRDDTLYDFDSHGSKADSSPSGEITRAGGLTENGSGYFVANRRVPLVGEGRIVNDLSPALISVINTDQGIGNIVDTNIDNTARFGGVADVQLLGNQIASVKDVNLVYAGGQEAGFIYNLEDSNLLNVDLLRGFAVSTYLDGVLQETKGGDLSIKAVELNVVSFAGGSGQNAVSISTQITKPFNEIKLNVVGISADVLGSLKLYYAFVGENPMLPCVQGSEYYPNSALGDISKLLGVPTLVGTGNLVDSNKENAMTMGAGLSVGTHYATVNLNKEVPAGYEIGFYTSAFDLLNLTLGGGFKISTYDSKGVKQEEYAINSLLGISVIKGSTAGLMSMITTKPCSQVRLTYSAIVGLNLGATSVYYAYVREPASTDISSYYSLSDAETALSGYRFHRPEEGNVVFTLVSQPAGAAAKIENDKLSDMTVPGEYTVAYTYTRGEDTFIRKITVRKLDTSVKDGCNNLIARPTYPDAKLYSPAGGGALINSGSMTSADNMVDENPDNYVDYTNPLALAANTTVVAVDAGERINVAGENVRTGFTFQTTNNFLGVSALKFFVIKLYDGPTKVFEGVVDNNSTVGVGLIGSNGDKVRFSVSTTATFDKIELWTAGVLNLNLNKFRIYNAFWEPTATCESAVGNQACMEIISQSSHGAEIGYERTGTGGVASVGSSFTELGNVIDTDKSTYATLTFTNVINEATLAVKFNEFPAGQTAGFIIQAPAGVADVDLIGNVKLSLYHTGSEVGSTSSGGILGLDVISYDGISYVETVSPVPFDEIVIEFQGVASLLKWIRVYGVYTRTDTDGDGIPDCAEPDADAEVLVGQVNTPHVCEGDPIEIEVTNGGTVGGQYVLIRDNYANNNERTKVTMTLPADRRFVIDNVPAGDYYFTIASSPSEAPLHSGLNVKVHPKTTAWKTDAASTDWNEWDNWTSGSPWDCTDVIIPKQSSLYPILKSGEQSYCANIHFETNTEVGNVCLLNYSGKAFIDMALTANSYHMLAAPLKGMVTGDMFIPAAMNGVHTGDYFVAPDKDNAPENRFNPRIYQRMWNKAVRRKLIGGGDAGVKISETKWTQPYNALAQPYLLGDGNGFSLWVDNGNLPADRSFVFRFPKMHTQYTYVSDLNASTGISESITRSNAGRFISEGESGTTSMPLQVTLRNREASDTFIAGNPFMTHIDVAKFLAGNTDLSFVKIYDGNTNNPVTTGTIAPMQSFFVVLKSGTLQNTAIRFTADMLTTNYGSGMGSNPTRSVSGDVNYGDMRMSVTSGSVTHTILLRNKPAADNGYKPGEDSEILFDGGVQPVISMFSVADARALDIQSFRNRTSVPIGIYAESPVSAVLNVEVNGDFWWDWILRDKLQHVEYSMDQLVHGVNLGMVSTSTDRFELVRK